MNMTEDKMDVIKHNLGEEVGAIETDATLEFTKETVERLLGRSIPEVTPNIEVPSVPKKDQGRKLKLK